MSIQVVLPVLNEAEALPWVLSRIPYDIAPIVVDNGSTDGSGDIAARLGAIVVTEVRRGFGSACNAGLLAASADLVCFMDCDGSLDPIELERVIDPVAQGSADLVLGARRAVKGAWPAHLRAANRLLAYRVKRRTGIPVTDLGPMRAARREALMTLGLTDTRFGWPLEMVLEAASEGWRVAETPVTYLKRRGVSKVTGTMAGVILAARDMRRVLASHPS